MSSRTSGVKRVVAGLGIVAVAAIAIWLATRDHDAPEPAPPEPAPQPVERPHAAVVAPSLPGQPRVNQDGSGVQSYTIDGIAIRDHRGSVAGTPLDLPPNIHPPNSRKIPATLTGDVAAKVRGVMADCARLLPAAARGPKARMEGEIVVSIKDGTLTVDRSMMQLRDVVGDPAPMKDCMEQKTVGLTTNAGDQADLTNYSIHVSFVVLPSPRP